MERFQLRHDQTASWSQFILLIIDFKNDYDLGLISSQWLPLNADSGDPWILCKLSSLILFLQANLHYHSQTFRFTLIYHSSLKKEVRQDYFQIREKVCVSGQSQWFEWSQTVIRAHVSRNTLQSIFLDLQNQIRAWKPGFSREIKTDLDSILANKWILSTQIIREEKRLSRVNFPHSSTMESISELWSQSTQHLE